MTIYHILMLIGIIALAINGFVYERKMRLGDPNKYDEYKENFHWSVGGLFVVGAGLMVLSEFWTWI